MSKVYLVRHGDDKKILMEEKGMFNLRDLEQTDLIFWCL